MSGGAFIGGCLLLGFLIGMGLEGVQKGLIRLAEAIEKLKR